MFGTSVRRLGVVLTLSGILVSAIVAPADAQIGSDRYAAIVTEARTGAVLVAANADHQRYPASLTKIMTVYMAFEALQEGRIGLATPVPVSATAAAMPPSRLGLAPGMTLTVEEAILALVTKSANDAAAALGEFLGGGSEHRFAQMMTLKARSLGMSRTTFRNASGLPDAGQVTTARDMALLGRRVMQDFPRLYAYFSTPHFVFRGRTHWNHNRLLQEYEGTDGIKTGYINDSGFNLVASAQRDGVRLIAAVFGGSTGRERDRHMMALLDQGFAQMGVAPIARRQAPAPVLVGSAQAATAAARRPAPSQARAPASTTRTAAAARSAPAARATPVRATTQPPRRPGGTRVTAAPGPTMIEQGDTSRGVARPAARSPSAAR
uniref:D-alanyl-D-alanine carboxypeptidase family protein n=1 Tax=Crenalkalicoccus roseus TaxID=1485588 RepID=UPI001080D048